jgi:enediyne biosynthesis protein E4
VELGGSSLKERHFSTEGGERPTLLPRRGGPARAPALQEHLRLGRGPRPEGILGPPVCRLRRFLLASFAAALLSLLAGMAEETVEAAGLRFREVSAAWGLAFRHHAGASGAYYMVETMGPGVVLFDYDGDGDPDAFFVDGGRLPGYAGEEPRSRLYRNDGGRFVDVTERTGIRVAAYGMGGTAGDVDGDGDLDLYVTAFGADQLFRNDGDGRFTDATAAAGLGDPLWSSSAAFADADRDGDLDLYVANYVDFRLDNHKFCGDREHDRRDYCIPDVYNGEPGRFYRNRGDGTFEEATKAAGLATAVGAGLGVIFSDLDGDGWPDLYQADDRTPNLLFRNVGDKGGEKGPGTFEDLSLASGAAYGPNGLPEGGMGVDAADADGDGRPDIVVTNFSLETNALYKNLGGGSFTDARFVSGLAEPSLLFVAFGVAFADLDSDGDLDVVVANGHVLEHPELARGASPRKQRNQLFENLGNGRFREVTDGGLDAVRVSRGLAVADLDGDGDLDVAIANCDDVAEVYENLAPQGEWLAIDLAGRKSDRFGIGAKVEVEAGGRRQMREARTASSYLSQNELTLRVGLGTPATPATPATPVTPVNIDRLTVRWPRGKVQVFEGLPAGRRVVVTE